MKYENFKKAEYIKDRIDKLKEAQKELKVWLKDYPNGDSDFGATTADKSIYSFYISEYGDGSGFQIDLSGCLMADDILRGLEKTLEKRIKEDMELLETL
jgi:hypothetical protein